MSAERSDVTVSTSTVDWIQTRPLYIWLLILALSTLAILPFCLVRFPPINDYPFHLARIVILAQLDNSLISRFYTHGSYLLPNVALDAFAVPLAHVLGAEFSVRLFVALSLVLTLTGAVALHASAHKSLSVWPLLSFIWLYNGIFRFGFFNYLFGLGLAFFAAAAWIAMPKGIARLAFAFGASIVLLFCHLEAFAVFAIIAGGFELHTAISAWWLVRSWRPVRDLLLSALPFIATITLFFLISPTASVAGSAVHYAPGRATKLYEGLFSLSSGIIWLDGVSAATLVVLLGWLCLARCVAVSSALALASSLLLLAFFVVPGAILGALHADSRLGPALAMLVLASLNLRTDAPRRAVLAVATVALSLAVLRTVALATSWAQYDREITPIVHALDKIEPGATLFAITSQPYPRLLADTAERRAAWQPPLKHVASYAVLHAPVFVPMIWANPTQQRLSVTTPFQDVREFQGENPTLVMSDAAFRVFMASLDGHLKSGRWPNLGRVYLLLVGAKLYQPMLPPTAFHLVAQGTNYALLKWTN